MVVVFKVRVVERWSSGRAVRVAQINQLPFKLPALAISEFITHSEEDE